MKLTKVEDDLFNQHPKYALVHCISEDAHMDSDIDTHFDEHYPQMREWLQQQNPKTGQVISYAEGGKPTVLNLITKKRSIDRATRDDFNSTIHTLKQFSLVHGLRYLAFPLISTGLDRLDWVNSEEYIKQTFDDTGIELLLCLTEESKRIHDRAWELFNRIRGS